METFRCWRKDYEEEEDGKDVQAFDARGAVEVYAEQVSDSTDCPTEQTILVRDEQNVVQTFDVFMERVCQFYAHKADEPTQEAKP